jgi:hypothetical protein
MVVDAFTDEVDANVNVLYFVMRMRIVGANHCTLIVAVH